MAGGRTLRFPSQENPLLPSSYSPFPFPSLVGRELCPKFYEKIIKMDEFT